MFVASVHYQRRYTRFRRIVVAAEYIDKFSKWKHYKHDNVVRIECAVQHSAVVVWMCETGRFLLRVRVCVVLVHSSC